MSTWPEEGGGRVVEGEVTSVAEHGVAPVANLNFSKELI
jgi:hypothetical protein